MKAVRPCRSPLMPDVLAIIIATSALAPSIIKTLLPFKIQPSLVFLAESSTFERLWCVPSSTAKQQVISPLAILPRKSFF